MFWHILELVSKSFSTPSEANWTEKACHILSEESVFASCRKAMPLQGGRVKSHAFICSCIYPFKRLMFVLSLCCSAMISAVLPQQSSFASARQFCTVLVFKHRTSASTWKQKLERVIKLGKQAFATNFPVIFPFFTHIRVFFPCLSSVWYHQVACDLNRRSQLSGVVLAGIPSFLYLPYSSACRPKQRLCWKRLNS